MAEPLIVLAIRRYNPEWEPPRDTGKTWQSCLCAFHGDTTKSAAVSYELDAYRCQACPAKGSAITLIAQQEEVPYRAAVKIAEGLSSGSHDAIPPEPKRVGSRRLFEDSGAVPDQREGRQVPARIRRRTFSGPRTV